MHSNHSMPFGAEIVPDGVRFALWAPTAKRVDLVCEERRVAMPAIGQGWYKLVDPEAKAGQRYGFAIDGTDDLVPDPASRFQADDRDRRSTIVDPRAYAWTNDGWAGRPWDEVVLNEMHVGTATPAGTYDGLIEKLATLKDTGITAIELMPIAEITGKRNWGYDGVLPFAPNNAYGTPDDLKKLVDAAHGHGLMVFLDVVYNHFGPTGNFLHSYAKSFFTERHETPWGAGINFDGKSEASDVVREFFIANALYWLEEYRFDGLRFDAVHAILDDGDKHFLDELAERIREKFVGRHVHLVLENEANEAHRLTRDGEGRSISYDAQWDDDIHHCWHVLLTGENEGYYADFAGDTVARLGRCLAEGFAYQGEMSPNLGHHRGEKTSGLPPQAFVAFLQNHDQIGNRAQGDRLTSLADATHMKLSRAVLYLAPQIPMIFQGDEWGATTPFQFFVDFEREPDLAEAVRKGRTKEFEKFASFAGESVPDPTIPETFERSKIDWDEAEREPHAAILAETRALLALRAEHVVPLMASGFIDARHARHGAGGLEVVWRFQAGSLVFVGNFADPAFAPDVPSGTKVLWQSDGLDLASQPKLPAWTGAILIGPTQ
ncbi:Malto-oligosyltrehalose trehalohydrolase [Beijerinckiaceae bacterium RH AL1]|nr:malto-oligosyltrehalose trehalohydrolase [Beijerinckiaceae bacterium]VVB47194.1 Malto-oligosyltrehalose trehalohydrolase [Beijerinckiaceae bacterium RH CH11]VVB47277.1 Malto-oligosyltrehalose trehalohydrolase [Beijerinckiaceae bacterium RH AL8]VVC55762.1 Malto-oligosyltrehalose trehalohydrolase [Beijerinckiaceae bacterium RH AL1]